MYFHLGPIGDLRALPPIERTEQVESSADAPSADHTSLSGARTRDVMGPVRREWTLPWVELTARQVAEMDALRRGLLGGPLWLIDPSWPNLAAPQVSTGGAERGDTTGWDASPGTLGFVAIVTPPPATLTRGAIQWNKPAAQQGEITPGRFNRRNRSPLLPDRGSVSQAAWLRRVSTDAVQVSPGFDGYDNNGLLVTQAWGPPVTVGTDWTELAYVWPFPPPSVTAFSPFWWIADTQPVSQVQFTGVRYGYGPLPPEWSAGGGAAEVFIDSMKETELGAGRWDVSMTLAET